MRWHIRRITRRHKLGVAHEDSWLEFDRIRFGRGTDAHVHLPDLTVALHHAEFYSLSDGRVACTALGRVGIKHQGINRERIELDTGDSVVIGRYRVTVLALEGGREASLEVETESYAQSGDSGPDTALVIPRTLSKRRIALVSSGVIALVFLVLPMSLSLDQDWRELWRKVGVGGDAAWSSGPLSAAHRLLDTRCETCHTQTFHRMRNDACMQCHQAVGGHAEQDHGKARCGSCHREHNGAMSLVRLEDTDCTRCHGQIKHRGRQSSLPDVHDFDTTHPTFTLAFAAADGHLVTQSMIDLPPHAEHSGLLFSHRAHLPPEGLEVDGKQIVLDCGDCHQADASGAAMKPVRMEGACEGCHRLEFEVTKTRELPHASRDVVLRYLRDYYAARALAGDYTATMLPAISGGAGTANTSAAPAVPADLARRRPGTALAEHERLSAQRWAGSMAEFVATEMIRYRACALCHVLDDTRPGELPDVAPVRLTTDWMTAARFNHARHSTMPCSECHRANESTDSRDVLMPAIERCQACHSSRHDSGRVISVCSDCHRYHVVPRTTARAP